jgi:hypothetical protein
MSLPIWVQDFVGKWLAVPQTQQKNFMYFARLLNPHCSPTNIYFGDHDIFVQIGQTLALLEERMIKGEGFGYDTGSKDT